MISNRDTHKVYLTTGICDTVLHRGYLYFQYSLAFSEKKTKKNPYIVFSITAILFIHMWRIVENDH